MFKLNKYSKGSLAHIILTILAIILVAGLLGYQFINNQKKSETNNSASNTSTYENSEYKFSFKYPNNMTVNESTSTTGEDVVTITNTSKDNQKYVIQMTKGDFQAGFSCDGIIYELSVDSLKKLDFSNRTLESQESPEIYRCVDMSLSYGGNSYRFFSDLGKDISASEISELQTVEDDFKSVLSTLVFE